MIIVAERRGPVATLRRIIGLRERDPDPQRLAVNQAVAAQAWAQRESDRASINAPEPSASYPFSDTGRERSLQRVQQSYGDAYAGYSETPTRYRLSPEEAMGHSLLNSVARYYVIGFQQAALGVRRVDQRPMRPRHEVLAGMAMEQLRRNRRSMIGATRDATFFGDGILLAPRGARSIRPETFVWAPYHLVSFLPSPSPPYLRYNIAGMDWPPDELIHFRNMPSFINQNVGDGPVFHLLDIAYADRMVIRRISAVMSGGSANTLFTPDDPSVDLDEKTIRAMETKLARAGSQANESTRIAFASRELKKISLAEDVSRSRFPELGRVTAERIIAEFRIPLSEFGIESGVGRNALGEGAERVNAARAVRNFLIPAWTSYAADLNDQLMPTAYSDSGELEYFFDTSGVDALRESDNDVHARTREDWDSDLLTLNQANAAIGLPEVSDETGEMRKSQYLQFIGAQGGIGVPGINSEVADSDGDEEDNED